jgi:peptide/nickel transport system permease protein
MENKMMPKRGLLIRRWGLLMGSGMLQGTMRSLVKAVSLFFAVSIVAFSLIRLSPLDPVQAYIGADASVTPEQRMLIAERWGLNEPPAAQFFKWFSSICRGDFGTSVIFRQPVINVIGQRAMASLVLMGASWLLAGLIGFCLGVLAGAFNGKWPDKVIKAWCLTLSGTPTFWLGLLLLLFFAIRFRIFPLGLSAPAGKLAADVTMAERLRHLILPCLTLSLAGVSSIAMHTRQKLAEVLDSDYVLYAKARGETTAQIIRRHGLRNIMLPAMTLQFASFSELFGGSVLAEQVFSYPGLGRTAVRAGIESDVPLLLGITLFSALFVFCGNTIANLLYRRLNPEIRSIND